MRTLLFFIFVNCLFISGITAQTRGWDVIYDEENKKYIYLDKEDTVGVFKIDKNQSNTGMLIEYFDNIPLVFSAVENGLYLYTKKLDFSGSFLEEKLLYDYRRDSVKRTKDHFIYFSDSTIRYHQYNKNDTIIHKLYGNNRILIDSFIDYPTFLEFGYVGYINHNKKLISNESLFYINSNYAPHYSKLIRFTKVSDLPYNTKPWISIQNEHRKIQLDYQNNVLIDINFIKNYSKSYNPVTGENYRCEFKDGSVFDGTYIEFESDDYSSFVIRKVTNGVFEGSQELYKDNQLIRETHYANQTIDSIITYFDQKAYTLYIDSGLPSNGIYIAKYYNGVHSHYSLENSQWQYNLQHQLESLEKHTDVYYKFYISNRQIDKVELYSKNFKRIASISNKDINDDIIQKISLPNEILSKFKNHIKKTYSNTYNENDKLAEGIKITYYNLIFYKNDKLEKVIEPIQAGAYMKALKNCIVECFEDSITTYFYTYEYSDFFVGNYTTKSDTQKFTIYSRIDITNLENYSGYAYTLNMDGSERYKGTIENGNLVQGAYLVPYIYKKESEEPFNLLLKAKKGNLKFYRMNENNQKKLLEKISYSNGRIKNEDYNLFLKYDIKNIFKQGKAENSLYFK